MSIQAYAAQQEGAELTPFTYDPTPLAVHGAEVQITHCGICHSDVHLIDDDWGITEYPLVPGHEIIGEVRTVGDAVWADLAGKRVGIGWQRSSCQHCEYCLRGETNMCRDLETTTVDHYGGFAEAIWVDSRFVFPIPDDLPSETAAPLLCAGITVYAPLRRLGGDASKRVGVVGIGGLGHLAVQFAAAMGCEVVAFSSTPNKQDEAQELGAAYFVNSREKKALKPLRRSLDLIISTVSVNLDWNEYLKLLKPNGILCFVGAMMDPITISPGLLGAAQRFVTSSATGGRPVMAEMLHFAARHGIRAWTETLPFDAVNAAIARLRQNDVRYRFVLEH